MILMLGVVDRWMIRQLVFASLIVTVVMTGPVILISLFTHLPGRALYSELLWPSLASITPMILYHVMPVLAAIAIIWCYGRFATDGTLVALHLTGRSEFSVRLPGFIVALGVAILGYVISAVIAPRTASHLHDALFAIRHNLTPSLLRANVFNNLDRAGDVFYFRQRIGDGEFEDVFIVRNAENGEKRAYTARHARFKREAGQAFLALLDGSMQVRSADGGRMEVVNFENLTLPLTRPGGAVRGYRTVDELDTPRFLQVREAAFQDPVRKRSWVREAVNRFGVPGMVLPHVLFGLQLLAIGGLMTERKRAPVEAICASVAAIHFLAIVLVEQIGSNANWAWAVVALIAVELLAVLLMKFARTRRVAYLP